MLSSKNKRGERFLTALKGVSDPEEKRKIIGREFIRVFEQAALDVVHEAQAHGETLEAVSRLATMSREPRYAVTREEDTVLEDTLH